MTAPGSDPNLGCASIRVVVVDYYMASPQPLLGDPSHTDFL
eukprot:gene22247-8791_t